MWGLKPSRLKRYERVEKTSFGGKRPYGVSSNRGTSTYTLPKSFTGQLVALRLNMSCFVPGFDLDRLQPPGTFMTLRTSRPLRGRRHRPGGPVGSHPLSVESMGPQTRSLRIGGLSPFYGLYKGGKRRVSYY